MAVGFKVKYYWYQIGTGDFLYSFFSTIAFKLVTSDGEDFISVLRCALEDGLKYNEHVCIESL